MASRPKNGAVRGRSTVLRTKAVTMNAAGMSGVEIAKKLGVTAQTVSSWLNEPEAIAIRESTRQKALAECEAVQLECVSTLLEIMRGGDETATAADRRQAAVALLDRGGLIPGQRVEHDGAVRLGAMSDADLETEAAAILERARAWKTSST